MLIVRRMRVLTGGDGRWQATCMYWQSTVGPLTARELSVGQPCATAAAVAVRIAHTHTVGAVCGTIRLCCLPLQARLPHSPHTLREN